MNPTIALLKLALKQLDVVEDLIDLALIEASELDRDNALYSIDNVRSMTRKHLAEQRDRNRPSD